MGKKLNNSKKFGAFALSTFLASITMPSESASKEYLSDLWVNRVSSDVSRVLNPEKITIGDVEKFQNIIPNLKLDALEKKEILSILQNKLENLDQSLDHENFKHFKLFINAFIKIKIRKLKEEDENGESEYLKLKAIAESLGIKTENILHREIRNGSRIIKKRYKRRKKVCRRVRLRSKKRRGKRRRYYTRSKCSTVTRWATRSSRKNKYKTIKITKDSKEFKELLLQKVLSFEDNSEEENHDSVKKIKPDLFYLSEIREKMFPEKGVKAMFPSVFLDAIKKLLEVSEKNLNHKTFAQVLRKIKRDYKTEVEKIKLHLLPLEVLEFERHLESAREVFMPQMLGKALNKNVGNLQDNILESNNTNYFNPDFRNKIKESSENFFPAQVETTNLKIKSPEDNFSPEYMGKKGIIHLNFEYIKNYNLDGFKDFIKKVYPDLNPREHENLILKTREIINGLPRGWENGFIRNLTNKIKSTQGRVSLEDLLNSPVMLHNTLTKRVAIYNPQDEDFFWSFFRSEYGVGGVGNKKDEHATPLGSFWSKQGPEDTYKYYRTRSFMHGMEEGKNKKYYKAKRRSVDAFEINPDDYPNSNSHARLIRVHGERQKSKNGFKETHGCIRLRDEAAEYWRNLSGEFRYVSIENMAGLSESVFFKKYMLTASGERTNR